MSPNNEQERTKSGGDDTNSSDLPLRKRKNMERTKKTASKPTGNTSSSASAPSKGRGGGGGGGKPSSRGEKNDDPKDPIVDKSFFDGG